MLRRVKTLSLYPSCDLVMKAPPELFLIIVLELTLSSYLCFLSRSSILRAFLNLVSFFAFGMSPKIKDKGHPDFKVEWKVRIVSVVLHAGTRLMRASDAGRTTNSVWEELQKMKQFGMFALLYRVAQVKWKRSQAVQKRSTFFITAAQRGIIHY